MKRLSWWKTLLLSLAVTLVLWAVFSWPLPKYFSTGIPSSSTNIEMPCARRMIHGDHLQLHYFYWLFSDMLDGNTEFLHNPYEFNTGPHTEHERYSPGTYNVPFSLVYVVGRKIGGSAFGWNLTGFVVLWATHFGAWLLLRRFTGRDLIAFCGAAVVVSLPFLWVGLLGGAPAAYAMMWVPFLLLGLDGSMRRASIRGGILAGIMIIAAEGSDSHVFYFGMLLVPAWSILVLLHSEEFKWSSRRDWLKRIVAFLPVIIAAGIVVVKAVFAISGSGAASRTAGETGLYSPEASSLIEWRGYGKTGHIYVGYIIPALLLIGLAARVMAFIRAPSDHRRSLRTSVLLTVGLLVIVALSLGVNGPLDGSVYEAANKLIPHYSLMRQTAKIFCIMPALLAVAAVLCADAFCFLLRKRLWAIVVPIVVFTLIAGEYACQVRPTICLLDTEQGAYAAVAEDAESQGNKPRIIVVPFWPGDSSWASLYEYYISLYHIRMLNGYRPIVSEDYFTNVFEPYGSVNVGVLSDEQLDGLLAMEIDYVILHENAFPEMVSPFPVGFTIKRFLNHPRLSLLARDEHVWAFEILEKPVSRAEMKSEWVTFFPTISDDAEWASNVNCSASADTNCGGGGFLSLSQENAYVELPFSHWDAPDPRIKIRARGHGDLELTWADDAAMDVAARINSDEWIWMDIPFVPPTDVYSVTARVQRATGNIDIDIVMFTSGKWQLLQPGETMDLPPALYFHAGYMDLTNDSVKLRWEYEPADDIVYGPKLPFPAGNYEVRLGVAGVEEPGVKLGSLFVECNGIRTKCCEVLSGTNAVGKFEQTAELPVRLVFHYSRNADVEITRIAVTRIQ